MLINFRKPDAVVLDEAVSYSGRFWIGFCVHYAAGQACWDICASDATTGIITRRHYHEKNNIAPQANATRYWEDEFKPKMLAPPQQEEEQSTAEDVFTQLGIREGNA